MENAADALKIAFGLIIFATAITMLFIMTTHTRSAADTVLSYVDETNYYNLLETTDKNREVSVSDVITTLYRYYSESIAVEVILKTGINSKERYVFDIHNETIVDTSFEALNSIKDMEDNLGYFINYKLLGSKNIPGSEDRTASRFRETFVEVPTFGIYLVQEDGTELALSTGSKRIYITYEEI